MEFDNKITTLRRVISSCISRRLIWIVFNIIKDYSGKRKSIKNHFVHHIKILTEISSVKFNHQHYINCVSTVGKIGLAVLFNKWQVKRQALITWLKYVSATKESR